jgi:predicted Zn-dependent peptidase
MADFILKENKTFKERYYHTTLENGFKITVIPKDSPAAYAMVCCDFGGNDIRYEKDGEIYELPAGTAHFLEHKMFESEDGSDAFLEFDNFGASANAFTSSDNTCYYYSCTENFFENLEILLKSVSSVHFSDASVEKEKKIIEREITMYEDLPSSNVSRNLSKALYHSHPTVFPISGTAETIAEITKETLFRAYNDFYLPANMSLCVCGTVDKEKVLEYAKRYFSSESAKRPKTLFPNEPETVAAKRYSASAVVASPLYCIGYKCKATEKQDFESVRRATAMRLAISLTFGRASDFFCENYEKGLLNERFYAGYAQARNTAHVIISGSGSEYEKMLSLATQEIERRKLEFFTDEQILREKKAAYAESLTIFDSGEDITAAHAANARFDYDEFDCIELLRDITAEEIKEALCSVDTDKAAISIIQKGSDL